MCDHKGTWRSVLFVARGGGEGVLKCAHSMTMLALFGALAQTLLPHLIGSKELGYSNA